MIGGHENDDADQDRNNIPINDKDNEQDAGTRTNAVLLFIICCFCSITVESTSLLKKVQSISADQVRDRSPLQVYFQYLLQKTSSSEWSTFLRLLSMNKSEWHVILIGCLVCIALGIIQPIFAILLAYTINASSLTIDMNHKSPIFPLGIQRLYI